MKKLIGFLLLGSISAFASQNFCVAKREIIPYSPFSQYSVDCNGIKIKLTAFFGIGLQEKFDQKLKDNGLNVILKMGNWSLISKLSRVEIADKEICLVVNSQSLNRFIVTCNSNQSFTLNSSNETELVQFAKSYNYSFLQKPQGKNNFYILSR